MPRWSQLPSWRLSSSSSPTAATVYLVVAPQLHPGIEGPAAARVLAGVNQVVHVGLDVIKGVTLVLLLSSTLVTDPQSPFHGHHL